MTLVKFSPLGRCAVVGFAASGSVGLAGLVELGRHLGVAQEGAGSFSVRTTLHERYGLPILNCELAASVLCLCQRCWQQYSYDISASVRYVILNNSSYERELGKHYEIIMSSELDGGKIDFHQLFEQELIVRCPLASAHDCELQVQPSN